MGAIRQGLRSNSSKRRCCVSPPASTATAKDDMTQFGLFEADYVWITEQIVGVTARHAKGRIVSVGGWVSLLL